MAGILDPVTCLLMQHCDAETAARIAAIAQAPAAARSEEPSPSRPVPTPAERLAQYEEQQRVGAEYDRLFDEGLNALAEKRQTRQTLLDAIERDRVAHAMETALIDGVLAADLLVELSSRPKSKEATERQYGYLANRFSEWAEPAGFTLPHSPAVVAHYLIHLCDGGRLLGSIRREVCAIAWLHEKHGYASPNASELVKAAMRYCAREARRPAKIETEH
jgi:hypothetical protein